MSNPSVIQFKTNEGTTPTNTQANSISTQFTSHTAAGNAIVAFYTVSDFAGVHTDMSATDTQLNTFTRQAQANSSATGGAASVAVITATGIVGDTTAADIVKTALSTSGDVEDFQAAFIVEVGNAAGVVGQNGNAQNGLAHGTNNVVSGNITLTSAQVPCLMVAIAMNTSGNGGAGSVPTVGTGMTLLSSCWAFGSNNSSCVATQLITVAGTYQAIFNQASSVAEDMATVAVCIKGSGTVGAALAGAATDTSSATGAITTAIKMAAAAADSITAAANLLTGVRMQGSASDAVSASGALTTGGSGAALAGAAQTLVTAAGALTTQILLTAGASDVSTGAALLSTGITLQAAASTLTSAVGALSTAIKLAGVASDSVSATGGLGANVAHLSGSASDATVATGAIQTQIRLAGAALDVVNAIGGLTTAIRLLGAATDTTSSASALLTSFNLQGSAADTSAASATLTARALFAGAAADVTTAAGVITTQIELLSDAIDTTLAVGTLTTGQSPSGLYPFDASFSVSMRQFTTPILPAVGAIEAHIITFDFSDELNPGETLQGIVTLSVVASAGIDPNPAAIMAGVPAYNKAPFTQVQIPVSGGVSGCDYFFVATSRTTNGNKILSRYALLQVRS